MNFPLTSYFPSRTSKAFHSQLTIKQCGIEKCYTDALDVFLRALDVPHQHGVVHAAVRQYLHRMVVCLEEDVLPYVPIAVEHLLKKSEARDLHKFMPLINQIISKFKVCEDFHALKGSRKTPYWGQFPDKSKSQLLPTRTTIPKTTLH